MSYTNVQLNVGDEDEPIELKIESKYVEMFSEFSDDNMSFDEFCKNMVAPMSDIMEKQIEDNIHANYQQYKRS